MSEAQNALIRRLENLQSSLGEKSSDFPLWRNLNEAMTSLMNYVNIEYLHEPTENQNESAREYIKKIEKLKKYLKNHPLGNKEKEALIYGL